MTFMTGTYGADEILKSDKFGSVKVPLERREVILDEFERSGISGIAYARHRGIDYQAFSAGWQRRKRAPAVAPARKIVSVSHGPFSASRVFRDGSGWTSGGNGSDNMKESWIGRRGRIYP